MIFSIKVGKKTIIVFDEFPYFIAGSPGLSSIFQYWWDTKFKNNPHIFLILCGSSISMMLEEVLLYKAPLYGRRTGQIMLSPMSFFDSWLFFPKKSFADFLEFYTVAGGVPEYLKRLSSYESLSEALEQEVFYKQSPLYQEVDFLLKEELREPKNYFSILKSLAFRRNRLSEIMQETGMEKSAIHSYLFTLENLGLVEKEAPVTEKNPAKSRKGRYWLKDSFFTFWFNFVLPFKEAVEVGDFSVIKAKLKKYFPSSIDKIYEKVTKDIVVFHKSNIGSFSRIGRYWDEKTEIDLMAIDEEGGRVLFGEAKWSNKKVGIDIYQELVEKAAKVRLESQDMKKIFALFSKSGFTNDMIRLAKEKKVLLFAQNKLSNL